jgi:hypothetical protein
MRSTRGARWAICALAISTFVPLAVAKQNKSLADCTTFDQKDKDETTTEMTVKNACTIPLDCTMSWRVVCAPDSKKRRNVHANEEKFGLASSSEITKLASAAVCGDDPWVIDSVTWTCTPNKD